MNKKVFLHVGLPKCGSTSIQNALSKNDDIDFVGFIPNNKKNTFWEDKDFAELFDRNLRFCCNKKKYWKDKIDTYIKKSSKKTIVFSSENISLRFLPWDLPTHIKLTFLKEIFPLNTEFIYVIKNPIQTLISLYKEWIVMGYKEDFNTFQKEIYLFKDFSFFNDLLLDNFLEIYQDNFELENIHILTLDERLKNNLENLLNTNLFFDEIKNKSLSSSEIELIREYNNKVNDMDSFFDNIELHRAYHDLEDINRRFSLARKKLIRKDSIENLKKYFTIKIDYCVSSNIIKIFYDNLINSKKRFKQNNKDFNIDYILSEISQYKNEDY